MAPARTIAQAGTAALENGGCFFLDLSAENRSPGVAARIYRTTTGVGPLDLQISAILFRASRAFSLESKQRPAFRLLPIGADGGDGFANDSVVLNEGTKGLVAVSIDLLKGSQSEERPPLGFEVIVGHEFGHIFQVRNNYIEPLKVAAANGGKKYVELHADFLAGWFMSKQNQVSMESMQYVTDALFSRGDNSIKSPEHHGTKAERFAAVLQGYVRGPATDSAQGAAENGVAYIQEIME